MPATIHDCICATDRIPPPVDVAVASEEEEEEARGAHRHDAPSVPTSASANRRRPSAVPITIEDDDDVAERHVKPTTRAVDNGGLSLVVSKETRRESAPSRFADGDASSNDGDRENRSPTAPAPALGDDGDEFDADLNPPPRGDGGIDIAIAAAALAAATRARETPSFPGSRIRASSHPVSARQTCAFPPSSHDAARLLAPFYTSERRGGVERRQLELKGVEGGD